MTLVVCDQQVKVALEYERQPKARQRYNDIRAVIERERRVNRFLYLFPDYKLCGLCMGCFVRRLKKCISDLCLRCSATSCKRGWLTHRCAS